MTAIDDFLKYSSLSDLKLSPEETKAAFVVMQPLLDGNCYQRELWMCDLQENPGNPGLRRVLGPGAFMGEYAWVDERTIFFLTCERDGDTVCSLLDVLTGKIEEEVSIPAKTDRVWYLGKDRYAYTEVVSIAKETCPEELDYLKAYEKDFEVISEIPVYDNGRGFVSQKRTALFFYEKEGQPQKLTKEHMTVDTVIQKPEGLYFTARTYDGQNTEPGIYSWHQGRQEIVQWVPEGIYRISDFDVEEACDGNRESIFFAAQDKRVHIMSSDPEIYRADGEAVEQTKIPASSVGDALGCDCAYGNQHEFMVKAHRLYYVVTEKWHSYLRVSDFDGTMENLTPDDGSVNGFAVQKDGSSLIIGFRGDRLQELYSCRDGVLERLSSFNEKVHEENPQIVPECFSFENHGFEVKYVVLKPEGFDSSQKYPAILYVHGGAKMLYSTIVFHEMQYLASQGYFVVYGNPRGSDGQGSEFAKLLGEYGEYDYEDMMKAMDRALELYPNIDEKRLGVAGGSYGGIMVNWIVTHTNRFRAAVAQRSICNMVSTFGTADNGFNFVKEQMDGDIWQGFDMLWKQSPLKYADKCTTPLLLIHSEEDYRCHYTESIQMFTALKYLGVESRMVLIRGENHNLSRTGHPVQRIKRLYEISRWFDEHLKEGIL